MDYAKRNNMFITGGSDTHTTFLLHGGMAFPTKLTDMNDFVRRLKNAKPDDYRVTDGGRVYDAFGGNL